MTTFSDLALREELLRSLTELGYEEPTPIQAEAIPPLILGTDLLGQAATGTGKTAAFALPLLQRISLGGPRPHALVLVPTRELAIQVSEAIHKYGRHLGARVLPVYGGAPIVRQMKSLDRGVDVVVATPGRAIDHLTRRTLNLQDLEVVVLDEADEMLDMGFAEDIETILEQTPTTRQTVLFSATMPPRIKHIVNRHLTNPTTISIGARQPEPGEVPKIRQTAYVVDRAHKSAALGRILDVEQPGQALVFCRTRADVDSLTETLNGRGYRAEALHGGLSQDQRTRVLDRLRAETADLLIATDVAARGLDIETLTHVVNFDVPSAAESYVHRIGRVGRAGREGTAITLAQPREHRMLKTIEQLTRQPIQIETIPTVADLKARRLELTRAALHESLLEDDLEPFRVVLDTLSDEFDPLSVALAAIKLAHEATTVGGDEDAEADIPQMTLARPNPKAKAGTGGRARRDGAGETPRRSGAGETVRIYIGVGRGAQVRPQDLVGAITGETQLQGREIGTIEIADRFSLVEVPVSRADEVIQGLRNTKLKGRKATVRREKFERR
jgi:ATP-dependent RNA helicase DeaD